MQDSNIPTKTPVVWASSAGGSYIHTVPNTSQIGIVNGAASFSDGFVPLNFVATTAGGIPPDGRDFNGILNSLSGWSQWFQAGAPVSYDSSFCTSIGGYPAGATLLSTVTPGLIWYCTADNNTTNPDGGSPANWRSWGPATFPTGTTMGFFNASAPVGWTQVTTYNDCAIRVVNGTGGTSYTSGQAFSTATASGTTDGHTLTTTEMPVHTHGIIDPTHHHQITGCASGGNGSAINSGNNYTPVGYPNTADAATGVTIQNAGSGSAHTHTFTSSALGINRVDMILCSKN